MSESDGIVPPPPLPVAVAPRAPHRRRRWILWTLVIVVLAVLGACGVLIPWIAGLLSQALTVGNRSLVSGEPGAAWSADGRWIFAQSSDRRGRTMVTAVRPSDGATKTLTGYWLTAIEQTGSRVRLMPDPGTSPFELGRSGRDASATLAAVDRMVASPWTLSDSPGPPTVWWDPSSDASPTQGPWADASRDSTHVAAFRTGVAGAYPVGISLRTAGRARFTIDSTRTMLPLGWSASGRYYAVVDLARVGGGDEEGDRHVTLRVWDVAARSEVASAVVMPAIATRFTWSPAEDALYWGGLDEESMESTADTGSPDRVYRLVPASHAGAQVVSFPASVRAPVVMGIDASSTLVRDLLSSPGRRGVKAHVRLLSGSRVVDAGSDTVVAIWAETQPAGVLWWQPVFSDDNTQGSVLGFGGGIRVWYAPSIETSPTLLLHVGY